MLRRAALGAAFLLATAVVLPGVRGRRRRARAEPASAAAEPAAAVAGERRRPDGASGKRTRKRRGKSRRGHGPKFAGRVVPESDLRTEPLPRPSGNLEIVSLANPNDRAKVNIYNADGSYSVDADGGAELRAALPAHRRREGRSTSSC